MVLERLKGIHHKKKSSTLPVPPELPTACPTLFVPLQFRTGELPDRWGHYSCELLLLMQHIPDSPRFIQPLHARTKIQRFSTFGDMLVKYLHVHTGARG